MLVQKKLRQEGELIDSLAWIAKLKEQGGDKIGRSASSAGGLKNTLKKMKPAGKKKRQRNITAPEISPEAWEGLKKAVDGKVGKEGKEGKEGGRGLFGKWSSKEKEVGGTPPRKQEPEVVKAVTERDVSERPGMTERAPVVPVIKEEELAAQDSTSSADDLSQKSEPRFSDFHLTVGERASTLPNLSRSKTDTNINYQTDLSQLSLTPSIPEEIFSTQSSFEAIPLEQLAPASQGHGEASSAGTSPHTPSGSAEEREGTGQGELQEIDEMLKDFRKGCPSLYEDYGDEQHKLNLKHVLKFLESCHESRPLELSVLQEWDGWTLASKEIA